MSDDEFNESFDPHGVHADAMEQELRRGGRELVGPVPTIRFHDGTRQAYTPPRDTMDTRYVACTEHRPACDCREALFAEELSERLAMLAEVEKAAEEILAGHPAYSWRLDPVTGEEIAAHCMCTGCQIARRAHLFAAWRVVRRVQDNEL